MSKTDIKFSGNIISVACRRVQMPNGSTLDMEEVLHPGGAAVAAINAQGQVCMLRQYRPVFDAWLWELPAGKIDNAEPPLETARRELFEETGITAQHWSSLGSMISSPGVFSEQVYLYLAEGLSFKAAEVEEHEVFEVHWFDMTTLSTMLQNEEITDAKTLIVLQRLLLSMPASGAVDE